MRLVANLLAFVILAVAYYALTGVFIDYISPPARQTVVYQKHLLTHFRPEEPPRVLIVGDSTAAFNYTASLMPHAQSLALVSGSFAEIYYSLERYLKVFPAPKCVLITASYNWAYHRNNRFWDIFVMNHFYSFRELAEIYDVSAAVKDFPASDYSKVGFLFRSLLYRLRIKGLHLADIQDGIFDQRLWRANRSFAHSLHMYAGNINKDAQFFPFIWDPHEHLNHPFEVAPLYDEYLARLVRLANAKGASVHWLQSPISNQVVNDTSRAFYGALATHLSPLVLTDPRNTFDASIKVYPDSEFFSATHLDRAGARHFTESNRPLFEACQ